MDSRVQKKRTQEKKHLAHAYFPQELHDEITIEIIPRLRRLGVKKNIQALVSEGVEMMVEKYRRELARSESRVADAPRKSSKTTSR